MKKLSAFSILATLSLAFTMQVSVAHAVVQNNTYTPLAPVPGLDTSTNCNPSESTAAQINDSNCKTDATTFIPALVRYAIIIAGGLAVVMIVIGGVEYATSDAISGKSAGKQKIENAIWGLVLALAAFVVLQTVNPDILNLKLNLTVSNASSTSAAPSASTTPQATSVWPAGWPGGVTEYDADVRAKLAGLKPAVTVADGDCSIINQTGCTSLDGLSTAAISGLVSLSNDSTGSGATIQINGGTEFWLHCVPTSLTQAQCADPSINKTMHIPGGGAVDLQANSALNTVITSLGKKGPATGNGCENSSLGVYTLDNGTYVKEDAGHWHICYH